MPIENERKYIVDLVPSDIDGLVNDYAGKKQLIVQAYVDDIRARSTSMAGRCDYTFTWKKLIEGSERLEIETEITETDFFRIYCMSKKVIRKIRIKVQGYGLAWDIDFLMAPIDDDPSYRLFPLTLDNYYHYLTIAEVEMPESMKKPAVLPSFVKDNFLYLVPSEQEARWTNAELSDPIKVAKMLKEVAGWEYG